MLNCYQCRRVTRRMRQELVEFRDSHGDVGDEPGVVVGDGVREDAGETLEGRAAQLEQENRELRERVQAQAEELDALSRQVAELGEREPPLGESDAIDVDEREPGEWRPPRRAHGMPGAGVVTMEAQPDE